MILELVDRRISPPSPDEDWFALFRDLVTGLAGEIGPPHLGVDLVLVSDGTMTELNRQWRHAEGPTDVLSFSEFLEESGEGLFRQGENHLACNLVLCPGTPQIEGQRVAGEIIIAPDFVSRRCRDNGWSVAAEFPLLVVHGLLHIVGWEHDTDEKKQAMQDVEESILAGHGLTHPLRPRS